MVHPTHTLPRVARQPKVTEHDVDVLLSIISAEATRDLLSTLTEERQEEALEVIATHCLTLTHKRSHCVWTSLAARLNVSFPGLGVDPVDVQRFCKREVLPHVVANRSYVATLMVERGQSFENVSRLLDFKEELKEAIDRARPTLGQFQKDAKGRLRRIGITYGQYVALCTLYLDTVKALGKEMERWGFVPQVHDKPACPHVDLASSMARLRGTKPMGA